MHFNLIDDNIHVNAGLNLLSCFVLFLHKYQSTSPLKYKLIYYNI